MALQARALLRVGRPAEALLAAKEASAAWPHWEAVLAEGEALVAVGKAHPARALLDATLAAVRAIGDDEVAAGAEVALGVALAEACRAGGDPESGIGFGTRALAFAGRFFGDRSHEAAEALHGLGVCHHAAGDHVKAIGALKRCLVIREAMGAGASDRASALDALGMAQRRRRQPFRAVASHRTALALWIEALGPRAGPVGACRHALAQALHSTGDFLAAHEQMASAYENTARTLGASHVDTWITAFELGRFEVDIGQVEEGLQRMMEARQHVADQLGTEHPAVVAMDRWL
jgi:tetratricopeptide (TPR) repeat protein